MTGQAAFKHTTTSLEQTFALAEKIAAEAAVGEIYCLTGELGSGKTLFAKGFATGLGVRGPVTSPTFTILNVYDEHGQRFPFYHFDVYRVHQPAEIEDTGYEEYFFGSGVCLIEWADIIKELIPPNALWIHFEKDYTQSENTRIITGRLL